MSDKFRNKYRNSSARATWHGYDGGVYFVTICTDHHNHHYFGEIFNCRDAKFCVPTDWLLRQPIKNSARPHEIWRPLFADSKSRSQNMPMLPIFRLRGKHVFMTVLHNILKKCH